MSAQRLRGVFFWLLAIIVALPLLAGGAGYVWWQRSLPQLDGEIRLSGLSSTVKVIRDKHGIPHIFADTMPDAARALGYLHAQDRMFQMDVTRRVLQGRISEAVGEVGLSLDKMYRSLDLLSRADESYTVLSGDVQAQFKAYAEGINLWLGQKDQALPLEYTLLGIAPEPWRPEDSVLWGKGMAWKLSANWRQDATRAMVAANFGRERAERLFPPPFPDWPQTLKPEIGRGQQSDASDRVPAISPGLPVPTNADFAALLKLPDIGAGASNEWVIDGSRSATGMPLLANDPHLELEIPILWYLVRITTPEMTLSGATAPGVPLVLLGQNGHIAWGFTTTDSDVQDLFIEKEAPDNPGHYQTPDGPKPIKSETVEIKVKDRPSESFTRRETRHGPIFSDAVQAAQSPEVDSDMVSLAWNGLSRRDTSAEAFFRINMARNWQEFQDALRLHVSPTQNIAYADREGNIGFINAGQVPIRKSGEGRYPTDGASGTGDWTGTVPFEGWPKLFNPQAGAIVNANNAVDTANAPYWFGRDQSAAYRAIRIIERLGAEPKHDMDSMAAIQGDIQAAHARDLLPFLFKLKPETDREAQVLNLLKGWDMMADASRPEPLILDWWLMRMNDELLKSGLDSIASVSGRLNASVVVDILRRPDGFCRGDNADDDCMGMVKTAFERTLSELSERHGPDITQWRWGDEHVALLENQVLDNLPAFRELFGKAFPSNGGFYSVNRGGSLGKPEDNRPLVRKSGAGFRAVYDLANPANSRFIIATGQSGHPLSPFYADQLPLYRAGQGVRLNLSEEELLAEKTGELIFAP